MSDTTDPSPDSSPSPLSHLKPQLALVTAWAAEEDRVGELWLLEWGKKMIWGRGDDGNPMRARSCYLRPGERMPGRQVTAEKISRDHLELCAQRYGIEVTVTGAYATFFNGLQQSSALLVPGDIITIGKQMVLQVVMRPPAIPALARFLPQFWGPFGHPNALGIVCESPAMWATLDKIAFAAATGEHVLVLGRTGSGKELAAHGVHMLSARAKAAFVAHNAAAMPSGLVEAELFGNLRGYPNPGMVERPGLVGEATGGTLFLDEIGRLEPAEQAKLLRALDKGEYRRLGESKLRHADIRLVGATNEPERLREDFRQRFTVEVELPTLDSRREDIPFLVRQLIAVGFATGNQLALDPSAPPGVVRPLPITLPLIERLLRRTYPANMRELKSQLWKAAMGDAEDPLPERVVPVKKPLPPKKNEDVTKGEIEAMLAFENGNETETAKLFGWTRDKLRWRMIQDGIDPKAFVRKR